MKPTIQDKNPRTDLAIEQLDFALETPPNGITQHRTEQDGVRVTTVTVEDSASAQQLGKPVGTYITIEPTDFQKPPQDFAKEVELIAKQLQTLLPDKLCSALIVGLGNEQITPDALGPRAVKYALVTRHLPLDSLSGTGLEGLISVSAAAPGVLGQTGIESAELVSSLCRETMPDVVIAIDALASKSLSRLGKTIQLSDTGISPGSGVMNARKALNRESLGVPVIAVGVPTVVDLQTIASDYAGEPVPLSNTLENLFVTPRGIDLLIEHAAKVAAFAINKALNPVLEIDEIAGLVA